MIPNDPIILLSFLNTKLRDNCKNIDELCYELNLDRTEIEEKLSGIGYEYIEDINQFK